MNKQERTLPEPDYRIFAFLLILLAVTACALFLIKRTTFEHDAAKDEVVTATFYVAIVTLIAVIIQIAIATFEFSVVRYDLERSLRESELWPYGDVVLQEDYDFGTTFFYYTMNLRLTNTGEVVDLLQSLIVGVDSNFVFEETAASNTEWTRLRWIPDNQSVYRSFIFFKLVSITPIYVNNYIELPTLNLRSDFNDYKLLTGLQVLAHVSSNFQRNPRNMQEYFIIQRTRSGSTQSKVINLKKLHDDDSV